MTRAGMIMAKSLLRQEDKVRGRSSYTKWKDMLEFMKTQPSPESVLRYFHNFMDGNHMYGTEKQARWSEESLELLIKDLV